MKAAKITPDGTINVVTLNGLTEMQDAVGGMIEITGGNGWHAYVNEEGLVHRLPINPVVSDLLGHHIVGAAILFGGFDDEGDEIDLSDKDLNHLLIGQARTQVLNFYKERS